MNNTDLISIITPMYNAEKYIKETIESVINQSYQNWEMVIVDNFSTDRSREIVLGINDSRIQLVKLDFNSGGPARPRNIGVDNSSGKYIAFLDADDLWTADKLEKQLLFMKEENLNFSSHNAVKIDTKSVLLSKDGFLTKKFKMQKNYNIEQLVRGNFIYLSSVILEKSIFIGFNEDKKCIAVEDYYLWLQLLNNSSIRYKFLHNDFLQYRVDENSLSNVTTNGKQEAKAIYYCLIFIFDNNRFDLVKYINHDKINFITCLQSFFRRFSL